MSKIIDGRALAKKIEEILRGKLAAVDHGRSPQMVSFCNTQDPPSVKYTKMKKAKAEEIGIKFIVEEYDVDINKDEILDKVKKYNEDENINGIMFQMPLPQELRPYQEELIHSINPAKDVDGLLSDSPFMAATVKAVISLIEESVENWKNKKIGVIGATGEVGEPLVKFLKEKNVDVVEISRSSGDIKTDVQVCDIVVSATGQKDLVKPEMIKNGVVLIDVGLGDFEEGCYEKAEAYTPIYGGVGPMTVISLMENAVESYLKRL